MLKAAVVDDVAVRHTPLTAIESPSRDLGDELARDTQPHAVGGGIDTDDLSEVGYQSSEQLTTP